MPDLTYSTATATQIAEMITGNSVTIDSATLLGNAAQTATYANGDAVSPEMTPGDTGVIFSTGTATDATNAGTDFNTQNNTSTNFGGAGDSDLNAVASGTTQDAAGIEFTFEVPADAETGRISFSFASEEFLEYVGGGFSDLAAIYVDGVLVPLMGTTDGFIDVDNGAVNPNYIDNPVAADNINSEFN
jgi:hypothetical protein